MIPSALALAVAVAASQPFVPAPAPPPAEGRVTLPLVHWTSMVEAAAVPDDPQAPPLPVTWVDRRVEGAFHKGLLDATLTATFDVHDDQGYLQVPVLDVGASPGRVLLDGQPTSLVATEGMYTIGVDRPGRYEVVVAFYRGQEQDRFARRLQLGLPSGGVTRFAIAVPEADIDASVAAGAVVGLAEADGVTTVTGFIDAASPLDLSWTRRLSHESPVDAALEVEARALLTLGEGLALGLAVLDVRVTRGETDRVDLALPDGVEVMRVDGDAVLQWQTSGDAGARRLTVLLRYLERERTRVAVRFQYPVVDAASVPLRLPTPLAGTPFRGVLGVQAPTVLAVDVAQADGVQPIALRELPSDLTQLTSKPLVFGFRFESPPTATFTIARRSEVELTSTLIDELQASTVVLEDGLEVTKMRLDIRNNTRQYLRLTLPPGAEPTHALLDGHPVRPATEGAPNALLFSLRQSERIAPGEARTHDVTSGQTLGDIALLYYGDPGKWELLFDANREVMGRPDLVRVGQRLVVPSEDAVTVEESAFVLEVAYKVRRNAAVSGIGGLDLTLPTLDVDAMAVTWHVYIPDDVVALDVAANLTQHGSPRYGPLRRLEQFLDVVFRPSPAEAGGGEYESILTRRKGIWQAEAAERSSYEVAPAFFPLTGQRLRFKRVLSDAAAPHVAISYISGGMADLVRALAFALAVLLGLFVFRRYPIRWWVIALGIVGAAGLLVVAHYILGVHRLLVWGVVLALVVRLWGLRGRRRGAASRLSFRERLGEPWRLVELGTVRNLALLGALWLAMSFTVAHMALLPVVLAAGLALWWRRWASEASGPPGPPRPTEPPAATSTTPEVSHA